MSADNIPATPTQMPPQSLAPPTLSLDLQARHGRWLLKLIAALHAFGVVECARCHTTEKDNRILSCLVRIFGNDWSEVAAMYVPPHRCAAPHSTLVVDGKKRTEAMASLLSALWAVDNLESTCCLPFLEQQRTTTPSAEEEVVDSTAGAKQDASTPVRVHHHEVKRAIHRIWRDRPPPAGSIVPPPQTGTCRITSVARDLCAHYFVHLHRHANFIYPFGAPQPPRPPSSSTAKPPPAVCCAAVGSGPPEPIGDAAQPFDDALWDTDSIVNWYQHAVKCLRQRPKHGDRPPIGEAPPMYRRRSDGWMTIHDVFTYWSPSSSSTSSFAVKTAWGQRFAALAANEERADDVEESLARILWEVDVFVRLQWTRPPAAVVGDRAASTAGAHVGGISGGHHRSSGLGRLYLRAGYLHKDATVARNVLASLPRLTADEKRIYCTNARLNPRARLVDWIQLSPDGARDEFAKHGFARSCPAFRPFLFCIPVGCIPVEDNAAFHTTWWFSGEMDHGNSKGDECPHLLHHQEEGGSAVLRSAAQVASNLTVGTALPEFHPSTMEIIWGGSSVLHITRCIAEGRDVEPAPTSAAAVHDGIFAVLLRNDNDVVVNPPSEEGMAAEVPPLLWKEVSSTGDFRLPLRPQRPPSSPEHSGDDDHLTLYTGACFVVTQPNEEAVDDLGPQDGGVVRGRPPCLAECMLDDPFLGMVSSTRHAPANTKPLSMSRTAAQDRLDLSALQHYVDDWRKSQEDALHLVLSTPPLGDQEGNGNHRRRVANNFFATLHVDVTIVGGDATGCGSEPNGDCAQRRDTWKKRVVSFLLAGTSCCMEEEEGRRGRGRGTSVHVVSSTAEWPLAALLADSGEDDVLPPRRDSNVIVVVCPRDSISLELGERPASAHSVCSFCATLVLLPNISLVLDANYVALLGVAAPQVSHELSGTLANQMRERLLVAVDLASKDPLEFLGDAVVDYIFVEQYLHMRRRGDLHLPDGSAFGGQNPQQEWSMNAAGLGAYMTANTSNVSLARSSLFMRRGVWRHLVFSSSLPEVSKAFGDVAEAIVGALFLFSLVDLGTTITEALDFVHKCLCLCCSSNVERKTEAC